MEHVLQRTTVSARTHWDIASLVLCTLGIGCYLGWHFVDISPTLFVQPQQFISELLSTWSYAYVALTVVVVAGAVWGYVLSQLGTHWGVGTFSPDPTPWLDSFVLMLTLLAQFLSAQKKWDCWIVWLVVNAANITLYLSAGLVFMPIVSALYLINGIWSLWTWFRLYRDGK